MKRPELDERIWSGIVPALEELNAKRNRPFAQSLERRRLVDSIMAMQEEWETATQVVVVVVKQRPWWRIW